MQRQLKNSFKKLLVKFFHGGQRLGVDVLPRHFYSEIPAIYELRQSDEWRQAYSLLEVSSDLDAQLTFVRQVMTLQVQEHLKVADVYGDACRVNGAVGFGLIEAQFLYGFVRTQQPKRIIQVGCGVSTAICLAAAKDGDYQPEITCIEPYPTPILLAAEKDGRITLLREKVECLPPTFASSLGEGDLLFIDSTHTLGPAGEVSRLILEVLPRLADGVYVHFHDIWFPYDFAPTILDRGMFFWHETVLLHAFLCFNPRFQVKASLSLLHHQALEEFQKSFHGYQPMKFDRGICVEEGDYPSSIYLQKTSV